MSTNETVGINGWDGWTSTHLQGVGAVPAKPAGELVPGDVTVWNFGSTYTITEVAETSAKYVTVQHVNDLTGVSYPRRLLKTRLVAVAA